MLRLPTHRLLDRSYCLLARFLGSPIKFPTPGVHTDLRPSCFRPDTLSLASSFRVQGAWTRRVSTALAFWIIVFLPIEVPALFAFVIFLRFAHQFTLVLLGIGESRRQRNLPAKDSFAGGIRTRTVLFVREELFPIKLQH